MMTHTKILEIYLYLETVPQGWQYDKEQILFSGGQVFVFILLTKFLIVVCFSALARDTPAS